MCFAAFLPFIVYLCQKRICAQHATRKRNEYERVRDSSDSLCVIFEFWKISQLTGTMKFRSVQLQIVRDFVYLLVNDKFLLAFQQVDVYRTDLTIIFEFLYNSNSCPLALTFPFVQCVSTMSYLH